MNKIMMGVLLLGVIMTSSCRKEYNCQCSTSSGGSTSIVNDKKLSKMSLSDARTKCDEGDSKIGSLETECEIKL